MTRMVLCTKYKEELEALDLPPMPGQVGQDLYQNVSKKAWQEQLFLA